MRTELFGVFGDREQFAGLRSPDTFDRLVCGETITVGVRDAALEEPGRTNTYRSEEGICVVWGEAIPIDPTDEPTAK